MVEKPFGNDLDSARALNDTIHRVLPRGRRSTGSTTGWDWTRSRTCWPPGSPTRCFEPLLNRDHVASVQITMAEAFDVADRGRFYDATGAIRDVVQNHMLQVLASVLADPPDGSGLDSWLDAKARIVAALRPLTPEDTVRGQYEGYLDVDGVAPGLDDGDASWRCGWPWTPGAGPGCRSSSGRARPCRSPRPRSRIRFRQVPFDVFGIGPDHGQQPAALPDLAGDRDRAQPGREGPRRGDRAADAGDGVQPSTPGSDMRPYDRLIGAALDGNRVLFARQDTVEAAWRVVDPILGRRRPAARPTRGAAGGPRRPSRCCRRARPGTTRPAEHPEEERWHRPHAIGPTTSRRDRRRRVRRPVRRPGAPGRRGAHLGHHLQPATRGGNGPSPPGRSSRCTTSTPPRRRPSDRPSPPDRGRR